MALLSSLLCLLCLAAPAQSLPVEPRPIAIDTAITRGPEEGSLVENDAVGFAFEATADGLLFPPAGFRCSLDGAAAAPCGSPLIIEDLEEGPHRFAVAAEDPLTGTVDPVPATRDFFTGEGVCVEEDEGGSAGEELDGEGEGAEATDECETEDTGGLSPRECLLRSARATVSTDAERARLTVRYTTFSPTDARVSFRLNGAKGSLRLGEDRRHLARRGTLRLATALTPAEATRVRAARRFTVDIDIAGAPRECRRYETRRLTVRRGAHGRQTWLQSDPASGPGA